MSSRPASNSTRRACACWMRRSTSRPCSAISLSIATICAGGGTAGPIGKLIEARTLRLARGTAQHDHSNLRSSFRALRRYRGDARAVAQHDGQADQIDAARKAASLLARCAVADRGRLRLRLSGRMEARDDRRYPAPGQSRRRRRHRMHIFCQGQGSPTVVVEQGIGAQSTAWAQLNERISDITTVCAYDRAGMGYSEPARPCDAMRKKWPATSTSCCSKRGITDDIVLVGWSAGRDIRARVLPAVPATA